MPNEPAPTAYDRKPAVRKHLMTPGAPARRKDPMSLSGVQRWVLSTLAATTILHMSFGLVVAAVFIDESRTDSRIGLLAIAGAFGIAAVVAALVIHKHKLVTPWLLLGVLPSLIGAYFMSWR